MRYCAGIDGGQSSTVCAIGDERGVVVSRADGPPADLVGEPRDSERRAAVIDAVVADALKGASLPAKTEFAAVVAGISGYDEGHAAAPQLRAKGTFRAVHDAEIAHAGAFDGAAGIVLIAGTGSVALGIDEKGRSVRCGGWGYLFGDEGSAFWIAREVIARAMRGEDSAAPGGLAERACEFFGVDSLRALQHMVAHREIERPRIAAFTPTVLEAARAGDRNAVEVRRAAVEALAALVHVVHRRLGSSLRLPIAPLGGVFADDDFLERWRWTMRALEPAAQIVKPKHGAAVGALLIAYRDAGIDAGPLVASET
jgi:N-acetylglucosamine kinase-like BadF-type ATPase